MKNKERPEGLIRARSRMRHFLDSSDEALDARMADAQTQPAASDCPPVDVEYRRMIEEEMQEEQLVAANMRAWSWIRTVFLISRSSAFMSTSASR